jgi:SAM-dependent methyltransferase
MACFLGMSVGCLAASRKQDLMNWVIPLTVWTVLLSCAVLLFFNSFGRILVDVGGQGSPQQVYFGTEYRPKDPTYFVLPIEAVSGLFFALIALIFVGLGQVMGRSFNRIPNRLLAYSINVMGSLAGIMGFSIASYFYTSPVTWFGISIGLCLWFVNESRRRHFARYLALLFLIAFFSGYGPNTAAMQTYWSHYYKITYGPKTNNIETNNISHQVMVPVLERSPAYFLPYFLSHDAGWRRFEEVLIIGAGSGNDVQAALTQGVKEVDGIEIDPLLYQIGKRNHPDRPYLDSRVSIHIDDGRSYLRNTKKSYDLVIYALVDSLVLHSGYSSLRLESFLFTEQAFRDIKARLKEDGTFVMYNFYRQGWVVARLVKMAEKVFGTRPLVFSLPYQERIEPQDNQANNFTLILVGNGSSSAVEKIRTELSDGRFFWANVRPTFNTSVRAYGAEPPVVSGSQATDWLKIGPAEVGTKGVEQVPTDDWPFLYLLAPTIPALNLRWMLMIGILSLAILWCFAPVRTFRPNGQMFFLGSGFMLLETKSVVHMALLFGSTWMINSIVFFAILIMILLSNFFVISCGPQKRWGLVYGLLITSLLVNVYVPMDSYLSLPGMTKVVVSCILVFLPLFFAGIIFALAFRDSQQPDIDIGSNIGGAILGGLSEYFSLMIGFNSILWVAIVFYLLSALMEMRRFPGQTSTGSGLPGS